MSAGLLVDKGILPQPDREGSPWAQGVEMYMADIRGGVWSCMLQDLPLAAGGSVKVGGDGDKGEFCHLVGLSGFLSAMGAAVGDILRVGEGVGGQKGDHIYSVRLLRNADVMRLTETIGRVTAP